MRLRSDVVSFERRHRAGDATRVQEARKLSLMAAFHSEGSQQSGVNRDFVACEGELGFFILCRGLNDDSSGEFAANAGGDTILNLIRPQAGALGRAPATPENCAKVATWMSTACTRPNRSAGRRVRHTSTSARSTRPSTSSMLYQGRSPCRPNS